MFSPPPLRSFTWLEYLCFGGSSLSRFVFFHEPWGFVGRDGNPLGNSTLTAESSYSCNACKNILHVVASLCWSSAIVEKFSVLMQFSWPFTVPVEACRWSIPNQETWIAENVLSNESTLILWSEWKTQFYWTLLEARSLN